MVQFKLSWENSEHAESRMSIDLLFAFRMRDYESLVSFIVILTLYYDHGKCIEIYQALNHAVYCLCLHVSNLQMGWFKWIWTQISWCAEAASTIFTTKEEKLQNKMVYERKHFWHQQRNIQSWSLHGKKNHQAVCISLKFSQLWCYIFAAVCLQRMFNW